MFSPGTWSLNFWFSVPCFFFEYLTFLSQNSVNSPLFTSDFDFFSWQAHLENCEGLLTGCPNNCGIKILKEKVRLVTMCSQTITRKCIGFAHDATKHFKNSFESVHAFQNELNFDERGKPEYPEKNLSEQRKTQAMGGWHSLPNKEAWVRIPEAMPCWVCCIYYI